MVLVVGMHPLSQVDQVESDQLSAKRIIAIEQQKASSDIRARNCELLDS